MLRADKIAYFEEECANEGDGRLVEKLKEFRGRLERLLDESVVREREWAEVHAAHTAFKVSHFFVANFSFFTDPG